jgi:hypothetical protein
MLPSAKDLRDEAIRECLRLRDEDRLLAISGASLKERRKVIDQERATRQGYFDKLPRMQLSRCPFTKQALVMAFDPWGVDGFWWQETNLVKTSEPAPPESFAFCAGH